MRSGDLKAVLLVLDDVWRAADARAFDLLGPRGRPLVTTRDKGILDTLHGELVPVSLFTDAEAMQLLADAIGVAPADLPAEAHEVAHECGNLPLALALCGGMASKRGGDFHSVLERLRRADLEKIADRESINEQHRSLWRAMQASVEVLSDDEQRRFAELAVFSTDQMVPEAAAATLWSHTGGLDDLDTEDLLIELAERSLVQLDQETSADGKTHRSFRLHDLLHDYAVRIASEPQALHQTLLDAYQEACSGAWHTGPNDGYFLQHLGLHLVAARRVSELLDLHLDLRWLEAKANAGLILQLRSDLDFVSKSVPTGEAHRRLLQLIDQIIGNDATFLGRHPGALFQSLWNLGWWYDCDEAQHHFDPPEGGWGPDGAPWQQPEPRLCTLLERWRAEKEQTHSGVVWLRSLRPLWSPLGGAQILCVRAHEGDVKSVAIMPNANSIVSGSSDKTICIWDAANGKELACLRGHDDAVNSVAIVPDATRIVSASSDRTIRTWDTANGEELACLRGHDAAVNSVAVSSNDWRIMSGALDTTLRVWNMDNGKELLCLHGHERRIHSVSVAVNGGLIVSGSGDGTVRVWDSTVQRDKSISANLRSERNNSIECVAISPKGYVVAGGNFWDNSIWVWDAAAGREIARLPGPDVGNTHRIDFLSEDSIAVEFSEDTRFYDLNTFSFTEEIPFPIHALGLRTITPLASPLRVLGKDTETVVEDATRSREIAWFPIPLTYVTKHPYASVWAGAGYSGGYLAIIKLEGCGGPLG